MSQFSKYIPTSVRKVTVLDLRLVRCSASYLF
uniref:Uncharacterized protein n=1 Tax=Anopheles atroparvus TaxID=41427 RepID=A0AAG5DT66_ANOAO